MCSRGSLTSWSSVSRAQAHGTKTCEWKQQNAASYVWDLNFYRSCLVLHWLCGLLTYLIMNSMAEQRQVHTPQEPRTADRQNKLCVCVHSCVHYMWALVCGLFCIQSDILSRLVVTHQHSSTVLMTTTPPWGFWYDPLELCLLIRVLPCPVGRGGWQDKWLSWWEWHSWVSLESLMWCLIRS